VSQSNIRIDTGHNDLSVVGQIDIQAFKAYNNNRLIVYLKSLVCLSVFDIEEKVYKIS